MSNPGLDGVTVAETRLSEIDGETGTLTIGGYPVEELATQSTFEETLFVLLYDRLPAEPELREFRATLAEGRAIGPDVRSLLRAAAEAEADPMDALRMGLAAASLDGEPTPTRVVAVVPTIVATYWRLRQGDSPPEPDPELGHAADYLRMLTGDRPAEPTVRGLETYLSTVVDHGLNASTFTARTVVSTDSDLVSAATAAVGALKGPLHGGAPGPVLEMLETIHGGRDAAAYVRDRLDAGERVMGFGHRVYDVRDPRAAVLSMAAEQFYEEAGDEAFFETVQTVEKTATELLAEHRPEQDLATNVEFYTAVLLRGVGVPRELFTPTFAVARVGGWMAHCLEQREHGRLIRPASTYVGERGREWVPVEER